MDYFACTYSTIKLLLTHVNIWLTQQHVWDTNYEKE